ncbi:hypothetical protein C8R44DRAFT_752540 [Mycena epipterygia]|nr:hypothetical protein C8R44DRAFT_752540 [Mycena epipterygia]
MTSLPGNFQGVYDLIISEGTQTLALGIPSIHFGVDETFDSSDPTLVSDYTLHAVPPTGTPFLALIFGVVREAVSCPDGVGFDVTLGQPLAGCPTIVLERLRQLYLAQVATLTSVTGIDLGKGLWTALKDGGIDSIHTSWLVGDEAASDIKVHCSECSKPLNAGDFAIAHVSMHLLLREQPSTICRYIKLCWIPPTPPVIWIHIPTNHLMSFYFQPTRNARNVWLRLTALQSNDRPTLWGSSEGIEVATSFSGSMRSIAIFGRIYSMVFSDGQTAITLYCPGFEDTTEVTRYLKTLFLRQIVRLDDLYASIASPDMPTSSSRGLLVGDTVVLNVNLSVAAHEPLSAANMLRLLQKGVSTTSRMRPYRGPID